MGLTCKIAGSSTCDFGASHTCRSLISLPRNTIYSNTSSLGGTGLFGALSSVPSDMTKINFLKPQHIKWDMFLFSMQLLVY